MAPVSNFIFFFILQLSTAQFLEDVNRASTETPPRRESNPNSAFLGKLGNLFLDFDEAFSRYAVPKIDADDVGKEQLYDKTQSSRSDYFGRIRENYRDLQKRVGSALGINGDLSIFSDFLGVNVRNRDDGQLVDVSLPFLPIKLSLNSNLIKNDVRAESSTVNEDLIPVTTVSGQPKSDFESNLKLGNMKIQVGSRSSDAIPRVSVDIDQPSGQARSSRQRVRNDNHIRNIQSESIKEGIAKLEQDQKMSNGLDNTPIDAEDLSSRMEEEFEPTETYQLSTENSAISGRILGDVLYSESTFDNIMKRVIKDSMWLLDSDLSPSKAFQRLNKFAQKIMQPQEKSKDDELSRKKSDSKKQSSTAEDEKKQHAMVFTDEIIPLKRNKSPKPLHYEVDNKPNTIKMDIVSKSDFESPRRNEENILLAFTLEGIPLKLKMPAEVQNPLRFLHETLNAAEVALNIPVNSSDDLEAAGKEILQLGAGNRGMMARALFVDLSDSQQLKSLLKILRKFKSTSF